MKINISLLFIVFLLGSCSKTIYYYSARNNSIPNIYGLKSEKNKFSFYFHYPKYTLFSFNWNNDLDSLVNSLNKENLYNYNLSSDLIHYNVKTLNDDIIFEYKDHIDTLRVDSSLLQKNVHLPVPRLIFAVGSISNEKLISTTKDYTAKYIKDSIVFYSNSPIERMHLFEFYPNYYKTSHGDKLALNTSEYVDPIIIGFSDKSGVVVYVSNSLLNSKYPHIGLECRDRVTIKCKSIKGLKKILR